MECPSGSSMRAVGNCRPVHESAYHPYKHCTMTVRTREASNPQITHELQQSHAHPLIHICFSICCEPAVP
eukprot:13831-Eustigmatos_ZCMA.PRE.1